VRPFGVGGAATGLALPRPLRRADRGFMRFNADPPILDALVAAVVTALPRLKNSIAFCTSPRLVIS